MYGYGFAPYVSVAEKKAKAAKTLAKLQKEYNDISPIIISGNKIATTWWGISWNKNLESYSDYSNRISRGRSYVRHGAVLDLKVHPGRINAQVQGSGRKPYAVEVKVDSLSKKQWDKIVNACSHQVDSLADLAAGKFPKELADIFMKKGEGLFPSPKEIHFDCSCPDWASMCKHIAAVLYGIGARLDNDPLLFFKLRQVDFEELLKKSVEAKMASLLQNANTKTSRVIDDKDIEALFDL